jgi:hypothetical protein
MGDEGLEQQGQNAGDKGKTPAGGAHVVQSSQLSAGWGQIRSLIADCPDLLPEARQSLIAQGDEAASVALRNAHQVIPSDCQDEVPGA